MKKRVVPLIKKCLKDYWDIAIIIVAIISIIFLTVFKVIDIAKCISTIVGLFAALVIAVIKTLKNNEQLMLISLTINYIMKKNGANIDELLGILIGGVWWKKKSEPVDIFFNCLKNICSSDDAEMKRRIAESLPALFLINRKESKVLIEILRCDWDDIWKSDNRRRTIESFPFLLKKENEFIKENLNVVYNDEIYTLISIVEVIYEWKRKIDKGEAENLFKDFITQVVGYGYSLEDLNTLKAEWNLLELIHTNPVAAVKKYDEIFTNETDYFMLICLARNLLYLCSYYPECKAKSICKGTPHIILKYVDFFLMEENHKNVRRPMAKECILDCLVTILKRREYISAVKGTIWKLIKDKDSIIRRPAFDKIDRICDIDNNFGRSIIDYLRRQEDDIILSDRAKELD